jgi:hypothetical protein
MLNMHIGYLSLMCMRRKVLPAEPGSGNVIVHYKANSSGVKGTYKQVSRNSVGDEAEKEL